MTRVFISYSRKDKVFAEKLNNALLNINYDAWIDWDDIPPTADWWDQIQKGIENADAFLFLLTPDSVASKVCREEIDHAVKNGKRLIPLVVRDISADQVHTSLTKLNWIFFREQDDFAAALKKLEDSVNTDLSWVEAHRRLQVRALEWDQRRDISLLLRGKDLHDAEEKLASSGKKDPQPTDLQRLYLLESRKRETRTRNTTAALSSAAVILLAIASIIAVVQGISATQQAKIATSRQLAAQASDQMDEDYPLSILLNVEAFNYEDTMEARSTLLRGLQRHSQVKDYLLGHESPIIALVFNPEYNQLASATRDGSIILWDLSTAQVTKQEVSFTGKLEGLYFSADGVWLAALTTDENGQQWSQWKAANADEPVVSVDTPDWCRGNCSISNVYFAKPTYENYADGHQGLITDKASDPKGDMLVTSGTDGALIFWEMDSKAPEGVIRISEPLFAHSTYVNRVAWSADGTLIASGDEDGNIVLWTRIEYTKKSPSKGDRAVGVDVSYWDQNVNWKAVQKAGISFAIVKSSEGSDYIDPTFEANWSALKDLGIPRSTYHFFHGDLNAKEQAVFFSGIARFLPGDLPPVLDIEPTNNQDFLNQDSDTIISALETWLTELERQTGKRPIIYSSSRFFQDYLRDRTGQYPEWLPKYPLWIGSYLNDPSIAYRGEPAVMPKGWTTEWTFWQFTDRGTVDGIDSGVDMNLYNGTPEDLTNALTHIPFSPRFIGNPNIKNNSALITQPFTGEPGAVTTLSISPDGKKMASGSANGRLILWDMENKHNPVILQDDGEFVYSVAFNPDGNLLAVSSGASNIAVWDISSQKVVNTFIGNGSRITSLAYNIEGSVLAAGSCARFASTGICQSGEIDYWDLKTGENRKIEAHSDVVNSLVFSPDGKWLVSGGEDGKVIFWDAQTLGQNGEPLSGHRSSVLFVKFSHNGQWLASAGQDKNVILWDVNKRRINGLPLAGHTRAVFALDFNTDDSILASGSWDHSIILWDVATHQTIGDPLRGHSDYVYALEFSPDGNWLVSGGWDNRIVKWDMRVSTWIKLACHIANRGFTQEEWDTYFPGKQQKDTCPVAP